MPPGELDNVSIELVRFSGCQRNFQPPVESAEGNFPLQLLTEPYVNLSTHPALVIQPPSSKLANEQITKEIGCKACEAIALLAFSGAAGA